MKIDFRLIFEASLHFSEMPDKVIEFSTVFAVLFGGDVPVFALPTLLLGP